MANKSISQAIVGSLAAHLKAQVPELLAVYDDFPAPSQTLKYPCASIFTGSPEFESIMPYVIKKATAPDANNRYVVRRAVGRYVFKLQLDVWCATKFDRHKMQQLIFAGFNTNSLQMGVSRQLDEYYDEFARFSMTGFKFMDSEEASQRSEWRVKFDIVADCNAILESNDYLIETIENNLETPSEVLKPIEESEQII